MKKNNITKNKKILTLIILVLIILLYYLLNNQYLTNKPLLIAHHTGGGIWPGNTIYGIKQSEKNNIKIINITTVLSKDNIPVLFHGFSLNKTTNGNGSPENFTVNQLQKLDAGYNFIKNGKYIYRNKNIKIPTLKQALRNINDDTIVIIDIKTHKYKKLIQQLKNILTLQDWKKSIFYSTNKNTLKYLTQQYPNAKVFLSRELTRKILLNHKANKKNIIGEIPKKMLSWIAYENNRSMKVCEKFTLGTSCTNTDFVNLWNSEIIKKIKFYNKKAKIIMINGNTKQDYEYAKKLNIFGIYTDYPLEKYYSK